MKKEKPVAPTKAATYDKTLDKPATTGAADKPAEPSGEPPAEDKAAKKPKGSPFAAVFESNPKADEIFVVDGMPFLEETHALNHARGDKSKVELVKR